MAEQIRTQQGKWLLVQINKINIFNQKKSQFKYKISL